MKRFLALPLLVAFELGAIVALHRVGSFSWLQIPWSDLGTWLDGTAPEDALAVVLRLVALVLAYWLAVSTVSYIVASATRVPSAVRAVEWATLPAVRRMVDRVAALSLVAATAGSPIAPAFATEPSPVVYDVEEGVPLPRLVPIPTQEIVDSPQYVPTPAGTGSPSAVAPNSVVVTAAATLFDATYEVMQGDNLWSIAARVASAESGQTPTDASIAAYWKLLISENDTVLRSGDPDMIYPGEVLIIPPLES